MIEYVCMSDGMYLRAYKAFGEDWTDDVDEALILTSNNPKRIAERMKLDVVPLPYIDGRKVVYLSVGGGMIDRYTEQDYIRVTGKDDFDKAWERGLRGKIGKL